MLKERCKAFLIGLLLFLLCLELLLRIVGGVYQHKAHSDQRRKTPGTYTILCLGDSYTFGMGAPGEDSYPRQLERLLNSHYRHKTFTVVNRGEPAQNSSQLLQALPQNLDAVKPDLAVIMTGNNNRWLYLGYNDYLRRDNSWYRMADRLSSIRIYRLLRLMLLNLKEKSGSGAGAFNPHSVISKSILPAAPGLSVAQGDAPGYKPQPLNSEAQVLWHKARAMQSGNDSDAALMCYLKALELDSGNPVLCEEIAQHYETLGKAEEAMAYYKKAFALKPGDLRYCHKIAWLYHKTQNNFNQARQWYKRALAINPRDAESYHSLGLICLDNYKYPEALGYLKKAVELDPEAYRYYHSLAQGYGKTGDSKQAEACLKQAIALNPQNSESYYELGKLYQHKGKIAAAEQAFITGIEADPKAVRNFEALNQLYQTRLQSGTSAASFFENKLKDFKGSDTAKQIFKDYLEVARRGNDLKSLELWLGSDIAAMLKLCRERGVAVILMDYPNGLLVKSSWGPSHLLENLARKARIPFINNRIIFAGFKDKASYFVADGHCNARGYEVIARALYGVITSRVEDKP